MGNGRKYKPKGRKKKGNPGKNSPKKKQASDNSGEESESLLSSLVEEAGNALKEKVSGAAGEALSAKSVKGSLLQYAYEAIKYTVETSRKTDAFNEQVTAYSQSEELGKHNIGFIRDEIGRLGLDLEEGRGNYVELSKAVVGSNLQTEATNTIFTQMSLAARGMNLSVEDTKNAFKALGNIMRDGVVTPGNLKQLEESFAGARELLRTATGMSQQAFGDALENGQIEAGAGVSMIAQQASQKYAANPEELLNAPGVKVNGLESEWDKFISSIGKGFDPAPFIDPVVDYLAEKGTSVLKYFNTGMDRDKFIAQSIEKYAATGTSKDKYFSLEKTDEIHNVADLVQGKLKEAAKGSKQALQVQRFLKAYYEIWEEKYQKVKASYPDQSKVPTTYYRNQLSIISNGRSITSEYTKTFTQKTKEETALKQKKYDEWKRKQLSKAEETEAETSGGRSQGGTKIHIDKLADITIHTTNIVESAAQVREIITKELLEVLNDANTN